MRRQFKNALLLGSLASLALALSYARMAAQGSQRATPAGADAATGSVSGRVVDYASGSPMRNVSIRIYRAYETVEASLAPGPAAPIVGAGVRGAGATPPQRGFSNPFLAGGEPPVEARTESAIDGAFSFTGLPPGSYTVSARTDHYIEQAYGQRIVGGRGRLVRVRAGEQVEAVNFQLTKKSVITGTLVDQNGSPRPNAEIQALAYFTLYSGKTLRAVGLASVTDDLGRYRLELDPGEYVVMARQVVIPSNMTVLRDGRGGLVITTRGRGRGNPSASNAAAGNPAAQTPKVVYVPAFYPAGGSDPAQAGTVRVPPGGEIHGIDFALRPTQSGVITGTVTPPGEPTRDSESQTGARPNPAVEPFRSTVSLVPAGFETRIGDPIVDAQEPPSVTAGSDGKFQFNDVLPGLYRLVVSQPRTRELMAIQDVDVRPGDTQALSIALQRGVDVSGRLQFDSPLPPNFDIRRCVATLRLDDRVNGFIEPRTNVNSDGSFVLKNVAPNLRYRVAFANLEQNWNPLELMYRPSSYLASVRYGDFDATVMPFTVRNEAPRIEAHVAFASGTVEILPTDRDQPQQGIPTLLVFQQHGQQNFEFRVSDASGKATFTNMPPGDYRVFAWDEIREGSWLGEPAFFDQIENRARKIHVENGATTTETVPIIKVEGGDLR